MRRTLLASLFLLAACQHAPSRAPLILVSIDGFRADYLDRGLTPALTALAAEGVSAPMAPSFPSLTYPNHYTLVTGLRPDDHGIVDNVMLDPDIPGVTFQLSERATVEDRRWWDDAEPVWVTAERAGLPTVNLYWPGSEAAIHGVRPSEWRRFDQAQSSAARVDQVLAWLDGPLRPAFVALYFDVVDTAGHTGGPDSPGPDDALREVDAAMARLREGLGRRGLDGANLIVVSDHGMAAVSPEQVLLVDDWTDIGQVDVRSTGAVAGLAPRTPAAEAALLAGRDHVRCWRKGELPERLHYGHHRRAPPVTCLADLGWVVSSRAAEARRPTAGGKHGYEPDAPDMAAIFIAAGPAFRRGERLPKFDNIHVYPLLMRLLGLPPQNGASEAGALEAALRSP